MPELIMLLIINYTSSYDFSYMYSFCKVSLFKKSTVLERAGLPAVWFRGCCSSLAALSLRGFPRHFSQTYGDGCLHIRREISACAPWTLISGLIVKKPQPPINDRSREHRGTGRSCRDARQTLPRWQIFCLAAAACWSLEQRGATFRPRWDLICCYHPSH